MQGTWKAIPLLSFVLLCGGAGQALAQEAGVPADEVVRKLQTRMDELKAQMAEIQSELDAIHPTAAKLPPAGSVVSTPPPPIVELSEEQKKESVGKATSEHQTFAQDEEDAPRLYNVPLEPTEPGFFLLPGTRTLMRLDGSARTDFIYDPRNSSLIDSFLPSSIPIPEVSDHGNFIASIRGSRVMADFRIPVTEKSEARTFVQLDFFGANGATAPRLRHFYAQLDNVLVGQSFTNFMDPDAFADSLDTQGVNSAVSVRVPQARYSFGLAMARALLSRLRFLRPPSRSQLPARRPLRRLPLRTSPFAFDMKGNADISSLQAPYETWECSYLPGRLNPSSDGA